MTQTVIATIVCILLIEAMLFTVWSLRKRPFHRYGTRPLLITQAMVMFIVGLVYLYDRNYIWGLISLVGAALAFVASRMRRRV